MARPQSKPVVRAAAPAAHPAAAYAAPVAPPPVAPAPPVAVPPAESTDDLRYVTTRMTRSQHRRLKAAAAMEGRTLESLVQQLVSDYLDGKS